MDVMQIMNLKKVIRNFWWALRNFNVLEKLPDSVLFVDFNGYITRANARAFECFGLQREDIERCTLNGIIKDGIALVHLSIKTGKPVVATAQIPGREFYVELNAAKVESGYYITTRDLTKLTNEIQTEEKIVRFNGEKNAMLVKVENDIKSPISSITGFSQGLLDGLGGDITEKQAKYIKIINSNSKELYQFIDKLLEFTYAESSLYESEYQKFDIVEVFKTVIKEFEEEISHKKIAFDFDYDSISKRIVYTDIKAVKVILRNILSESLIMTDSGYIQIKLTVPEEEKLTKCRLEGLSCMQISIKDTGIGTSEEEMRYLCDPYAQLEKGRRNFLRALKLGAASIFVKRLDGFINIMSEIMQGTEYEIIIPVEKENNE